MYKIKNCLVISHNQETNYAMEMRQETERKYISTIMQKQIFVD